MERTERTSDIKAIENRETFMGRLRPITAPSDMMNIEVAYAMAKHAHRFDKRKEIDPDSGEFIRYFEHLRRVALILMDELGFYDPEMIIAALMHDAIEDTRDISDRMLEHLFGKNVAMIVKLLTKEPKEGYYSRLSRSGNWQALVIKGCDRLDNLRSLGDCSVEFKLKQLTETREKIFPLMQRLVSIGNDGRFVDLERWIAGAADDIDQSIRNSAGQSAR